MAVRVIFGWQANVAQGCRKISCRPKQAAGSMRKPQEPLAKFRRKNIAVSE